MTREGDTPQTVRVPAAKVGLSTASVYPETAPAAFELAAALGYDGVEVMVWNDPISQDLDALRDLQQKYSMPVLSVHAPCLIITQRVWSADPWERLRRSREAAEKLGGDTVVVHPPFRWQREYARNFVDGIRKLGEDTAVKFAVENMFPLRARGREFIPYAPHWDPTSGAYQHFTLDTSHTAVARTDALAMLDRMGGRLAHLHLADGGGLIKDEHLVPGRGDQPCGTVLERLAARGFSGSVVVEVGTRGMDREQREADLAESLAFARLHLAAPAAPAAHLGAV
ncbi:sugar phosphate isomerase/epimerase family protein [Cryptosporangium sp. NPDC048952]|uniref:sugar phosphate isomerase/epimerase family protein n=1 Tax=Cryptosporangium sp. NPDC048952 TaxID=3363961 RepID=UPI0037160EDF